jgi:hypothetical protein
MVWFFVSGKPIAPEREGGGEREDQRTFFMHLFEACVRKVFGSNRLVPGYPDSFRSFTQSFEP